jgi:hypothetical protein
MRIRQAFAFAIAAAALVCAGAEATEIRNVPVVTQIQGVTFYRTSMTISNGNPTITTPVEMLFSYRSPADGTFQTATLTLSPLGPHQVRFFDDIVQEFKNAGRIRAADVSLGLFGTLLVAFPALDIRREAKSSRERTRRHRAADARLRPGLCFDCAGSQFLFSVRAERQRLRK